MTKALFLPVLAVVALLSFSGASSTTEGIQQIKEVSKAKPFCGPWLTFYNNTSYTITNIKVQNSSVGIVNFSNPTFPFTYQPGYGGFYYIWVTTSSGGQSGIVSGYLNSTLVNCRVFISPQVYALSMNTGCDPYDIIISEDTECP
jgi:hypothetical protein